MGEITCRSMLFAVTLALLLPTAVSRLDAAPGAPQSAPLEPPPTNAPDEPDPAANGDGSTSGTIQEEDDDDLIMPATDPAPDIEITPPRGPRRTARRTPGPKL